MSEESKSKTPPDDARVLTREQLAALAQCSTSWLDQDRKKPPEERRGPPFIKIGKLVRYPRDTAEPWLAGGRRS